MAHLTVTKERCDQTISDDYFPVDSLKPSLEARIITISLTNP
jgi:hypothetical protein